MSVAFVVFFHLFISCWSDVSFNCIRSSARRFFSSINPQNIHTTAIQRVFPCHSLVASFPCPFFHWLILLESLFFSTNRFLTGWLLPSTAWENVVLLWSKGIMTWKHTLWISCRDPWSKPIRNEGFGGPTHLWGPKVLNGGKGSYKKRGGKRLEDLFFLEMKGWGEFEHEFLRIFLETYFLPLLMARDVGVFFERCASFSFWNKVASVLKIWPRFVGIHEGYAKDGRFFWGVLGA